MQQNKQSNVFYWDFGEAFRHVYVFFDQGLMHINTTYDIDKYGEVLIPVSVS